jgi:hypothetical protein
LPDRTHITQGRAKMRAAPTGVNGVSQPCGVILHPAAEPGTPRPETMVRRDRPQPCCDAMFADGRFNAARIVSTSQECGSSTARLHAVNAESPGFIGFLTL